MKVPVWFSILVIIAVLPLGAYLLLLEAMPAAESSSRTLLWLYPPYVLLAAFCSWRAYGLGRREVAWIVLILLLLTHAAIWLLPC